MNAMPDLPKPSQNLEFESSATFDARDLIKDGNRVCIVLDEQVYYLRITRAGKLILTK